METNTTGLMSGLAGQLYDSSRAFCADLGRLLRQIAADRHSLLWLLLLTAAGIVVRLWFLDQPMRYDEANTYMSFVEPGVDRVFYYEKPNNHVAHTLLVYVSTSLFGSEPWAIRLPAFLAGILAVPTTYLCARTVFRRSVGLVAAGLVASSPVLVLYSTNARGYSSIVLITTALIPLSLYWVRKESSFAGILVAVLMAIGLFTIPIMLFPIAMLVVWSILLAYHSGGWSKTLCVLRSLVLVLLLFGLVTVLLYTPVILTSGLSRLVANNIVRPRALSESVALWPQLAEWVWGQYFGELPVLVRLLFAVCLSVGTVYLWKVNRPAFLLVPASLIGIGLVLFATRTLPFVRTWTFLLPLGYCLVDAGITAIVRLFAAPVRVTAAGALGLLFAVGISYNFTTLNVVPEYPETGPAPDAEAIVQYLEPRLKEGDWVLVRRFWPYRYYGHHLGMPLGKFAKEEQGDGDIYVVVQLPGSTFEKVVRNNYPGLDKEDYVIQEFPSTLLYVPRGAAD